MSGTMGKEQHYILESVEGAHNLLFDPTLWVIMYLWARRCFGNIVRLPSLLFSPNFADALSKMIEQIYHGTESELHILADQLKEPL